MVKNQLKFAIRLFKKDGVYSVLNILGLSLGIAVGIILVIYLQHDLNYDKHHENHQNIYRLTNHMVAQGADFNSARTARELPEIMQQELPEILEFVRFQDWNNVTVTYTEGEGKYQFIENDIVVADSNVFNVFTHQFLEGNPKSALEGPNKTVLAETVAKKYFKDESALGKVLDVDGESYEVTGVIKDVPVNSHLFFDIMLSQISDREWVNRNIAEGNNVRVSEAFWNPSIYTYFLMPDNYDVSAFNQKFQDIIFEKTFGAFGKQIGGSVTVGLQPLADIHFTADQDSDEPQGDIIYLYTFTSIGILIIFLACINYMNLATARSITRTSEISIRKVLGNSKTGLFSSIILESVVLAFFAMFIAIALVYILFYLTPFLDLIDKRLEINFLKNPGLILSTLLVTLSIGVVSGLYPALYIPSVSLVTGLKGPSGNASKTAWFRKIMIVFQFVISLFVIISTFLMDQQIAFVQKAELGFAKENVVLIDIPDTTVENSVPSIRNAMEASPNIISTTTAIGVPGLGVNGHVFRIFIDGEMKQQATSFIVAGNDYLETMGIELIEGRKWIDDSETEGLNFIVNETAVKEFGWGDEPLQKVIRYFHGEEDGHVIGVVKDFNFQNLHNEIEPLILIKDNGRRGTFHVRVRPDNLQETLAFIEQTWTEFSPNHPYEYRFLDEEFNQQYREDETQKTLISSLSYISIFISILGLIGLSAFTAGQKIKEIGVRKTLGASVPTILMLFSKSYVQLIIIAFVISIPLSNYMITEWMSEFAYRLPIQWWHFLVPGLAVISLGLATVMVQSLKAAKANPVDALRTE